MRERVGVLLCVVLASACLEPAVDVDETSRSIAGGTLTTELPAIVSMRVEGGYYHYWTGTVIAPRVVLTCAHGFISEDGQSIGIDRGEVMFGPRTGGVYAGQAERVVAMADWRVHPMYDPDAGLYDVALVLLAEDAEVEPMAVAAGDLGAQLAPGDPVQIVGFGDDAFMRYGIKRTLVRELHDVTPRALRFPRADVGTRPGDSGGPLLVDLGGEPQVAAVTRGWQGAFDIATRVDVHVDDFILPTVASWTGVCVADGVCRTDAACVYPDPDCTPCGLDHVCDRTCAERDPDCGDEGWLVRCDDIADCAAGMCVTAPDDERVRYCAAACDPELAEGCGDWQACVETEVGGDRRSFACMYDDKTPSTQGTACANDGWCVSGICHDEDGICAEPCVTDADCPAPFACVADPAGPVCAHTPSADATDAGGCRAAPARSQPCALAALVGAVLLGRRRRR